jgi:ATP-dependent DNA helicase RecG
MSKEVGISTTAIYKNLSKLKRKGVIRRVGPDKGGHWEVTP